MGRCQKRHATTLPTQHSVCNCPEIMSPSSLPCAPLYLYLLHPRYDWILRWPLQILFRIGRLRLVLVAIPEDVQQITTNQTKNVVSRFGQSPSPVDCSFGLSNAFCDVMGNLIKLDSIFLFVFVQWLFLIKFVFVVVLYDKKVKKKGKKLSFFYSVKLLFDWLEKVKETKCYYIW